jgi:hypothetical protein
VTRLRTMIPTDEADPVPFGQAISGMCGRLNRRPCAVRPFLDVVFCKHRNHKGR